MFARITVESGIAAGTSHRINRRVARVGSDPQADVCLPSAEIPSHALTLEFREESCLVYNRCSERIYVGAQVVEVDEAVEWPETDILQLGQNTELLLDFDEGEVEEETPDYLSDECLDDSVEAENLSPEAAISSGSQGKGSKTAMQLGVTLLCIIGCAFLLIRDQNRKSTPDSGIGFSEVITRSLADNSVSPALIQRLQYAEAQRVRGRDEIANEKYQEIRNDLVAKLDDDSDTLDDQSSQILRFVQTRLSEED